MRTQDPTHLFPAGPEPPAPESPRSHGAAPKILLSATLRWTIAARLAVAFDDMGCTVEAICPRQQQAARTRAVRRIHRLAPLTPLVSLRQAIERSAADLVIPCDDNAAVQLAQLYAQAGKAGHEAPLVRAVIARSLGRPEACARVTARAELMSLAASEGVRVPPTAAVTTRQELDTWLALHPLPAVLKVDATWGGLGVAIVTNSDEARRAFARMSARPSLRHALARLLLDRDVSHLLTRARDAPRNVTVQDYIVGAPANRAVACWQGRVLAGSSVEAIQTQHATGPATVVRVIGNTEMSEAVERLVKRLGLSGLWGVDFVIEAATGAAYLIEMNPRATPICHLPLGPGHDLPAALYAQCTGSAPHTTIVPITRDVIALFPGEWRRDPASPYLRSAYHDIPWGEDGLVQECIARPWAERGLIARLWARLRPKSSSRQAAAAANGLALGPNDRLGSPR